MGVGIWVYRAIVGVIVMLGLFLFAGFVRNMKPDGALSCGELWVRDALLVVVVCTLALFAGRSGLCLV